MGDYSIVGGIIAVITFLVSYRAFKEESLMEEYCFDVDAILIDKEYKRLITSGFVHSGWLHLLLNLGVLLSFAPVVESYFGMGNFLLLYFGSKIGGSLLALYVHRNHGDYQAVGASGAISGVIFSYVAMFPQGVVSFVFIPVEIKAWVLGLVFVLVSILGIKSQSDNIGHEAHLGGAITGVLLTVLFAPEILWPHFWVIAGILVPAVAFIVLIARNPNVLIMERYWGETVEGVKSGLANAGKKNQLDPEEELDRLLEKIRKQGMGSLSEKERNRLDELSRE